MRGDWAASRPDLAKKVLAAYLRGVSFMQNSFEIDEVVRISDEYHRWSGTTLSHNAIKEDLILRPLFNLDQQLDHLDRNFANDYTSDADRHYIELEDFLFEQGVITNKFYPKEYVVDTYMKLVSEDPELRAFSYYGAGDFGALGTDNNSSVSSNNMEPGLVVGIVLSVVGVVLLVFSLVVVKQKQTTVAAFDEAQIKDHDAV